MLQVWGKKKTNKPLEEPSDGCIGSSWERKLGRPVKYMQICPISQIVRKMQIKPQWLPIHTHKIGKKENLW
jgi:hypothetical protein